MKVLLLTIADELPGPGATGIERCAYEKLRECAAIDRFGEHSLTDDPASADFILFAEMGTVETQGFFDARLRAHALTRRYPDKCFVWNAADLVVPFLPGIYASVEQSAYDTRRVRSGHYLSTHISEPPLIRREHADRDLLFSFVGNAANSPVRQEIMRLHHPRSVCRDTSAEALSVWSEGEEAVGRFLGGYAEVLSRSQFALCPRGQGPSSMRLFESLRFGVAPVIISDAWVPPTGPAWDTFSVRVAEAEVADIPALLESREGESDRMGELARLAWEEWFAPAVSFHRVVGWCLEIMTTRDGSDPTWARRRAYCEVLRPQYLRKISRDVRQRWAASRSHRHLVAERCESS